MDKYVMTVPNHDKVFKCKYCSSRKIKKKGIRKNKSGQVQRISCLECNKQFSTNIGFRYRQYSKDVITDCLQMSFSGMSVRQISRF